ncbi:MAG: hypothetical protein IKN53_00235, partial [Oscillibacter sp.]|nr:hypothetical protein [Oscillibacter sp.]
MLDYAEVKALAVGNPLVKQRVETANELTRYQTLQRRRAEERMHMEQEAFELPSRIRDGERRMEACGRDAALYEAWRLAHAHEETGKSKRELDEERKRIRELIASALEKSVSSAKERTLMTYRGFRVVLPGNMLRERPYVWLVQSGRYCVELGET